MADEEAADGEVLVVRIYLHEAEHGRRKSLMREVLSLLGTQHRVGWLVVFRGIAGLDESGEVDETDILRMVSDLPLAIEFFDSPAVARAAIASLAGLVPPSHILCWRATRAHTPNA
ncbi:MAG TPA: DUF190 domain-containing protein [Acetobacteraceae bacterium]|jgi:uncharacterized protein|nr:DUF190 domain-containing protein [Acetobacteraceae bacterium]